MQADSMIIVPLLLLGHAACLQMIEAHVPLLLHSQQQDCLLHNSADTLALLRQVQKQKSMLLSSKAWSSHAGIPS